MRRRVLFLVTAVALFVTKGARADAGAATATEDDTLVHDVEQTLAARRVPAAAFALVDARGSRSFAAGLADVAEKRPATRDTPFRVASVSKLLVPLVVLSLVEEGRLALDTKVHDALPSLAFVNPWENERPLRVVDLLEGTTGWDDLRPAQFARDRPQRIALLDVLASDPAPLVSRWRPGSYASYANAGPTAAAAIAETIAERPYETLVRERVLAPLGMSHATFEPETAATARAYDARRAPLAPHTVLFRPSAGLAASASDMANLVAFFVARGTFEGKSRLSEASFARMLTATATPGARAGLATAYALCMQTELVGGRVWRGHRGGFEGTAAALFFDPARAVGYFVALDVDDDVALEAIAERLRAALETGHRAPAASEPSAVRGSSVATGFYAIANPRFARSDAVRSLVDLAWVSTTRDGLFVEARSGHPLAGPYVGSDGRYRRTDEPVTTLVARDDGAIEAATVALAPVPLSNAVARILGLAFGVAVLGSFVPHTAWLAFARYRRRRVIDGSVALRVLPLVAIVALVGGLGVWATSDPSALGAPSPRAVAAFVAASAFPLATVAFGAVLVARWRLLTLRARAHLGAVLAALVLGCVHFARFGLLFVRPWE